MRNLVLFLAVLILFPASAMAQMPAAKPVAAPAEPDAIPLYGDRTPGSAETEIWTTGGIGLSVRNVTRPTITPVLPPAGSANGSAVVVAPGGAFIGLAFDLEGRRVAHALAERGITAFVLKYRLIPTPLSEAEVGKMAAELIGKGLADLDHVMDMQYAPAAQDGLAALAWVRAHAAQYGLDPQRVGIMGFSAGAMTSLSTVLRAEPGEGPSFVGYIYGPELDVAVPADAAPLFAALAADDPLFKTRGIPLIEAWQRAKRPVEFHLYQKGGHGFGLGIPGTTTTLLMDEFVGWLAMNGFVPQPKK
jgi:acetyl esterase/lipase